MYHLFWNFVKINFKSLCSWWAVHSTFWNHWFTCFVLEFDACRDLASMCELVGSQQTSPCASDISNLLLHWHCDTWVCFGQLLHICWWSTTRIHSTATHTILNNARFLFKIVLTHAHKFHQQYLDSPLPSEWCKKWHELTRRDTKVCVNTRKSPKTSKMMSPRTYHRLSCEIDL